MIESSIVDVLEKRFNNLNLQDLPSVADTFKDEISNYLRHYIHFICFPKGKKLSLSSSELIIAIGNKVFEVIVSPKIENISVLSIVVLERGLKVKYTELLIHQITCTEPGMYSSIELNIPLSLSKYQKKLVLHLETFLFRSNLWITDLLSDIVFEYETKISRQLYRYLRSIINNKEVYEKIWLSTITNGKAHYIIDSQMTKSTITQLTDMSQTYGITPTIAISHFLNCNVPIEDSFGLIAAKQENFLNTEMKDAKYLETLSNLSRSQAIVFATEKMTLYSLYNYDGNTFLNCTFPSKYKNIVEPILEVHKEQIGFIFSNSIADLLSVYDKLSHPKSKIEYSSIGEFFGGVVMGVIKST